MTDDEILLPLLPIIRAQSLEPAAQHLLTLGRKDLIAKLVDMSLQQMKKELRDKWRAK